MATRERGAPEGAVEATQEKGKELVSQAQDQVQEKATELKSEAAFQIREQVDRRSTEVGEQVQSFGQALRHSSERLRTEGKDTPAKLVEQVADKADDLGSYLRSVDGDRILADVEDFTRRRPWLAASVGAAAGFVASRFLKASSDRRYERSRASHVYETAPSGRRELTQEASR